MDRTESLPTPRPLWPGLVFWLLACFAAPVSASWARPDAWYAALVKPAWNPPGWVFGPVWTTLYLLMGTAAWLVWRRGGWGAQRRPLGWFAAQLALNALWTPLFFGFQRLLPSGLAEEKRERRLSGIAIKSIGGLLEFDPIEQSLNVAGDRVGRHDERGIERVDVVAGHRSL